MFRGQATILERLSDLLGVAAGQARPDGQVSLGMTSCSGLCDQGPSGLVNGQPLSGLDRPRLLRIAELVANNVLLEQWPSRLLEVRPNIQHAGPLLDWNGDAGAALSVLASVGPDEVWARLDRSGLRGRGGAGFKAAAKWAFCRQAAGEHYVVCNADEGEPGTFKDRALLQTQLDLVLDGMTVCGLVVGARRGLIYLRGEYRFLEPAILATLARRRSAGLLGAGLLGRPDWTFEVDVHLGAGSYVCGEESALIESLEGKRGIPRVRPPFPVTAGYLGQPTVVNNVETFAAAAAIALHGDAWFRRWGTDQSSGTKLFTVSGDCHRPGVYEYPLGTSLREILEAAGAGQPQAVQVSGASGACAAPADFDRALSFEDLPCGGAIMVFGPDRDMLEVIRNHAAFFAHESCGHCTPCRVGTTLTVQLLDRVAAGQATARELRQLQRIASLMKAASHCGLGQTAPNSVLDGLAKFPAIFEPHLQPEVLACPH